MSCLTWSSLHNNIKQLVRAEWERCCLVDWQGKGPGNPIITVPSTVEEFVPGARGPVSVSVPVGLSKRTEELQTVRRMSPWTLWSTNSRSHCSSREEGRARERTTHVALPKYHETEDSQVANSRLQKGCCSRGGKCSFKHYDHKRGRTLEKNTRYPTSSDPFPRSQLQQSTRRCLSGQRDGFACCHTQDKYLHTFVIVIFIVSAASNTLPVV